MTTSAARTAVLKRPDRATPGREARRQVARSEQAAIDPKQRKFDPVELLLKAEVNRVPELLPVKYGRMAVSPFAFFRGAVSIMAADLASQPNTNITVQLCGDAHVQNLGSFETPDGRIVFDINDFDETIAGPWEWDVKRMAASIVLAGMESDHNRGKSADAAHAFAASYVRMMDELADEPILVAARHPIHLIKKIQPVSAALKQAQRADPLDLVRKYTEQAKNGQVHFRNMKPLMYRLGGTKRNQVLSALPAYRNSLPPERLHLFDFFRPLDVGFKVVGTGSVGLRDYVVLMEGNGPSDPLFLQLKQEVASSYAPYLKAGSYANQGRRVVEGQHKIQPISDLLLGWTTIGQHDFLVRQLNDHKGSIDMENLRGNGLTSLAQIAGELLARGHARSGDALAIKGYLGNSDKAIDALVSYATSYTELATSDFEQFQKAVKQKRIETVDPT